MKRLQFFSQPSPNYFSLAQRISELLSSSALKGLKTNELSDCRNYLRMDDSAFYYYMLFILLNFFITIFSHLFINWVVQFRYRDLEWFVDTLFERFIIHKKYTVMQRTRMERLETNSG